jgi:AraC-like DNA-binding protein
LGASAPFTQEVLPHPCVNLVVEQTAAAIHGVGTRMFRRELTGSGRVLGIKFAPGGFSAFFDRPLVTLTDASLTLDEAYGEHGSHFADAIRATDLGTDAHALCRDFLRAHFQQPDALAGLAMRGAAYARTSPHVSRVEQMADHLTTSVRTLQRAFRLHVGVSPNWVIRRFRIHEAAERARRGEPIEWSRLAHELGYFDQAHFLRDFKAQMGRSPARYAAECRNAGETG